MEIAGYGAAVLIGVSLGLIGGGGSALALPVLVYLFRLDEQPAILDSFFIVGIASLTGALSYIYKRLICYQSFITFGIPSVLAVYLTRHLIFPSIANALHLPGGIVFSKDILVLIIFSVLMLLASLSMIRPPVKAKPLVSEEGEKSYPYLIVTMAGLGVGFLAGLVGAGGGFLIIPVLVVFVGLPMKRAIGTSLLIIFINSGIGFAGDLHHSMIDWSFLLLFGAFSVSGIFVGMYISKFISGAMLKPAFGWFILAVGTFMIMEQVKHIIRIN
jgi:uncharacterized membrane protein YfcA